MLKPFAQELETILLHGGQEVDDETGSRAVPIYQTTSYVFKNTKHAQDLFGLEKSGNIYTRISNPTVSTFEKRMALLEDGVAAVATSSGMAAITLTILTIAEMGDEIIVDRNLYGGTYNLFANTLPKYGIQTIFVDGSNSSEIKQAITDRTKAIFAEMITNPSLNIFDVETVGDISHHHGIPLIIDNTFAPYIAKPLAWGADIVIHSATKWIGGHGTTIGGVVVDGGRFNWANGRFPSFTEPDETYQNLRYIDVGLEAFATKLRSQLLRDIGASLSPNNAFLLLQGLETLHLRMERHQKNAKHIATYLQSHPAVEWVNFPGLSSHSSFALAKKYLKNGCNSIITFGVKGGRGVGRKVIDHVKLWSHVANVGDAKSLIIHPASTTHQQLTKQALEKNGVSESLIRLSVGLECVNDLIKDLDQAIKKSIKVNIAKHDSVSQDTYHWLLKSPFERSNEKIRKKVIAVYDDEHAPSYFYEDVKNLATLGYKILFIKRSIAHANVSYIDGLLAYQSNMPESFIEELIEQRIKFVWIENAAKKSSFVKRIKKSNVSVFINKRLFKEIDDIRRNDRHI